MLYPSKLSIHHLAGGLPLLLWLLTGPSVSAETGAAERLQTVELDALNEEIASQQTINRLDNETRRMTDEYWALLARQAQLTRREAALEAELRGQVETLQTLRQQLPRVPPDADLDAFLQQLVEALDAFIRADLPFQREDRLKRVARLARLLEQPETSPAERLRQILFAYQQELEYGRTIESYDGQLTDQSDQSDQSDDGEQPWVSYLRYGRVALVYQHLDGQRGAWWDRESGRWQPLEPALNREVRRAIRIARKQLPPDLVLAPLRK
ncbi:hypothetical protein Thiowin_02097 [Thiorhodovibrio winogradskyi]|uniref:DUF3450 domain-containing protein n=1 Tax=Thiorhodovibrio winogradskyi TaxID=77007 RepID=A0ABZ0S9B3_9GAMM|nr:DUF3450 domain-containing protein [Thiorhodovibrio winogradskyi]